MNAWRWLAFFSGYLLLACYFLDTSGGANPISRALPTLMLAQQGTWKIDSLAHLTLDKCLIAGHYYSDKAPLASVLCAPFVWLFYKCGFIAAGLQFRAVLQAIHIGNVVCGSLPFAGIACLFLRRALVLRTALHPVLMTHALLLGSFLFAYTGTYFGHLLGAFFLLAAYVLRDEAHYRLSGLFLGLAFLSEYPTALALPIWLLEHGLRRQTRAGIALIIGFAPAALAILIYNNALTGSPWTMTYKYVAAPEFANMHVMYGFGLPTFAAAWALLFGLQRGLFYFAPVLGLVTYLMLQRRQIHPVLALLAAQFCLTASYATWWGGACFGPRHLLVMGTLALYTGLDWLASPSTPRAALLALAALGHVMAWISHATLTHHLGPSDAIFTTLWAALWLGNFNGGNLLSLLGGMSPDYAVWLWFVALAAGTFGLMRLVPAAQGRRA